MQANAIRRAFVDFFTERGHTVRPSASLIPTDPTLLLTNAGMVPFKPYFLGEEPAPWPRAVSIQKCVRTVDIDLIGTTARHLTMFEMLGNFSFGDYFKEQAIRYAYDFVTGPLGLDPGLLWYTVHETDDEAEEIWIDGIGVPADRVQRGGNDNFWQMGVPGPCGPASELFIDRGPAYGPPGGPIGGGEDRFVELWNLVFMQNIQDEPYHVVGDLPAKSIDTGTGLERLAMVLQGVDTLFEVDCVQDVLQASSRLLRLTYGEAERVDVALRLLADHARASTFLIGDRVMPGNEGRGYVVRRLIRRAVRHAWQLGSRRPIMPPLAEVTMDVMAEAYPDLVANRDFILHVFEREESQFRRTLATGIRMLDEALEITPKGAVVSGSLAFRLHDTYGFPIHLTREIVTEQQRSVDMDGYEKEMAAQRARAKAAWKGGEEAVRFESYKRVLDAIGPTDFLGYGNDAAPARVLAMLCEGEPVDRAVAGQVVEIFLDRTPFYAEAGGQVGDVGIIESPSGRIEVGDTQAGVVGLHGHRGRITRGFIQNGQPVDARIDGPRRDRIRKSHTGTHLLHSALREVIGDHANQAGSLVEDGRLRFDFSHYAPVSAEELSEVEGLVNRRVVDNHSVGTVETTKDEAEAMGALAFFGDKYGDRVRVVSVGGFSVEFCGGTHVDTSAEIGPLLVTTESSIGANLRRVEALTGMAAYDHARQIRAGLADVGRFLGVPMSEVPDRVRRLADRADELASDLARIEQRARSDLAAHLAGTSQRTGDTSWVIARLDDHPPAALREVGMQVRDRLGSGVVVLGSSVNGKGALLGLVSRDLVESGFSAADIVLVGARILGGGGSRDPELAQAGGPTGAKLGEALDAIREAVSSRLAS
ncbi:MAG: alanine--tRNA ligase [bacterium]|nr:alanine--tRNA ligase [bacterium]